MRSRSLSIIAALLLAGVATLAVYGYTNGVKKHAQGGGAQASVIVAKQDIRAGTAMNDVISSGGFQTISVPRDDVVPGAVTSLDQLRGKTASAAILAGEQIPTARLSGGQLPGGNLGIPKGYQAYTVALDPSAAVGSAIAKGDRVAVYGELQAEMKDGQNHPFAAQIVPDARVLDVTKPAATGGLTSSATDSGKVVVTLALKASEAQKVLLAQEEGSVALGLIGPGDKPVTTLPTATAQQMVSP